MEIVATKFEIDVEGDYRAEIDKLLLVPYNSYYGSLFMDVSKDKPMKVKIYKQDNLPVIHLQNSRIVLINRAVKELLRFKKELFDELNNSSNVILDISSQINKYLDIDTNQDPEKIGGSPYRIVTEDSYLIIPKDSNSRDVLVLSTKRTVIDISK